MITLLAAMNKINYQKILDGIIEENSKSGVVPKLLLHACCAPCSSYCLEYLSNFFEITVFYFNPNISIKEEYEYRLLEEKRLISLMEFKNPVTIIDGEYNPSEFFSAVKGLENEPEGGIRCEKCFRLRLEASAKEVKKLGCDYFATTLTISPLKNSQLINSIGEETGQRYGVKWLFSDFKKKEGYKRSIVLSKKYELYRQNYCGCIFSKQQSDNQTS
ncbi:MAG: epoxyqueuosine reductase QueH [Ruminococcus sp.]|nr:epoxyqueuosine reductase QueH [Ruminococcus sp.]MDY6202138.1 epoxyqueuosine reductase QueH [Ruminococcus sp.]